MTVLTAEACLSEVLRRLHPTELNQPMQGSEAKTLKLLRLSQIAHGKPIHSYAADPKSKKTPLRLSHELIDRSRIHQANQRLARSHSRAIGFGPSELTRVAVHRSTPNLSRTRWLRAHRDPEKRMPESNIHPLLARLARSTPIRRSYGPVA